MLKLDNPYDFYKMDEEERKSLVGKCFKVRDKQSSYYYPLQLKEGQFNYGVQQGVIFVSPVNYYLGQKWFRVGVFSPDDLDFDLDIKDCTLRQEVISFIEKMPKVDVTYRGVLESIQKHFNAGELQS